LNKKPFTKTLVESVAVMLFFVSFRESLPVFNILEIEDELIGELVWVCPLCLQHKRFKINRR
jgi:hypothetical protein